MVLKATRVKSHSAFSQKWQGFLFLNTSPIRDHVTYGILTAHWETSHHVFKRNIGHLLSTLPDQCYRDNTDYPVMAAF